MHRIFRVADLFGIILTQLFILSERALETKGFGDLGKAAASGGEAGRVTGSNGEKVMAC